MEPIEKLVFALQILLAEDESSTPHLTKKQAKIDAIEAIRLIAD